MRTFLIIFSLAFSTFVCPTYAASLSIGIITPNADVASFTTITFKVEPSGFTGTMAYTVSDSFPGSTLSNAHINKFGEFNWTPQYADVGTHNITITATDSTGYKATVNQTLVVREPGVVSIKSFTPGSHVFPDKNVSFSVSALGYVNPQFSVSDSFYGSTVTSRNMSSDGNFGWTPTERDVGSHSLTVRVTGANGRNDTVYQTIVVQGIRIEDVSNTTLPFGNALTFIVKPYGISSPTYRVSGSMRGNTIDSGTFNGNRFTWVPTRQDVGQHTITVTSVDMYNQVSTAKVNVTVTSSTGNTSPVVSTPKPVQKFQFTKNLSVGSKGVDVTELQKRLKEEGFFTGPANGNFGPQTKVAVQKYQKAKNISQLGNVGPATRAMLNR
ncbi:MAG: hypothetical protein FGM57_00175 [Candidatus Taylorbacteria bacterium]|nr:hypothetical protein [Candidatus Taylorbacteria bacterium]